jgi:hypothetical protein
MMDIGALLRLNMRDLVNEPMMRQIMLHLLAQQCDGLATLALIPYEPLPDELRRLVEQFDPAASKDDGAERAARVTSQGRGHEYVILAAAPPENVDAARKAPGLGG